jgi:beta-phosphoglucomutase family hydrolase
MASLARDLALILDMDGVIIHSNPLHRKAWEQYSRRFGIDTDEAMHQRMYGRRNDDIVRDFFGPQLTPHEVHELGAAMERLYRELMGPVVKESLVPGVVEFLKRHREVPIAMATSAEPENVEFLLEAAGLRPYFRAIVDGHQVRDPKPHPEIYLKAAELLGAVPRDCVAFEDSFAGIQSAQSAGMRVVGIRSTHDELPGVDLQIRDFDSPELEPWLASR